MNAKCTIYVAQIWNVWVSFHRFLDVIINHFSLLASRPQGRGQGRGLTLRDRISLVVHETDSFQKLLETVWRHETKNGGVDTGRWGLDPWKYVGGVRVCFDPTENVTFFHSKLFLDNSASFTSLKMKDLCQKRKIKLIFGGAYRLSGITGIVECLEVIDVGCNLWNSLMAWPDWPRPP